MSETIEDILKDIQRLLMSEGVSNGRVTKVDVEIVEDNEMCPPLPRFNVKKVETVKTKTVCRSGRISGPG